MPRGKKAARGKKTNNSKSDNTKKTEEIKRVGVVDNEDGDDEVQDSVDAETDAPETKQVQKPSAAEKKKIDLDDDHRHATGVLVSPPTARDVKIANFSLLSYGRELIQDALLEFTIGRRYGLIGPNGSGKSTFLHCLASREVPIPPHIDIFLLEEEAKPSEFSALECVVNYMQSKVRVLEEEADALMEKYGADDEAVQDIYDRLDDLDPSTFESRAGQLLYGLGFTMEMVHKKTKDMSGGWRMRVSLAQALLAKPTLLLLDEPTNHLDLEAVVFLEEYLRNYKHCLLIVSHSQDFLNSVCTNIIHITPQHKLKVYGGNYDTFIKVKAEQETNQMKKYKKEQDDIKKIKQFIASCGTYSNLVRQGKSKQKIIDRMEEQGLTEKVVVEAAFVFHFPEVEQLPPPIIAFHDVSFAYSGNLKDALYKNVNLGVNLDSRVALVGPNGAGKSTLLKLMVGELQPTAGQIRRHIHLSIGRYHQHSNEQLDPTMSPLDLIRREFPEQKLEEQEWRAHLGRYGVRGMQQTTPIGKMSDGQKSRMVFAMLAFRRPHVLLLDEPTNHLDMECIDSLAEAINTFEGGVVLVSHDFRLISQVAKELWECADGAIKFLNCDIKQYKRQLIQRIRKD